jgi:ribosome-associated heat shock protein Hsp15
MDDDDSRVRLDKWLWAARFFQTRSLAAQAVDGGRVRVNGLRVKPARELKVGDEVTVHVNELEWVIDVRGLSIRRGPATEARTLYQERPESIAKRDAALAVRKLLHEPAVGMQGRPTKRDRRLIRRFTDNG